MKPLREQCIVITGASSGIGLATARRAAKVGAKVVLAARNAAALNEAVADIRRKGGDAVSIAVDVADDGAAEAVAAEAIGAFDGFDTWVNDAGVSVLSPLEKLSIEEHRRVFEVGYFGTVKGSLAALAHLKGKGGTIINVGSILSDRAVPLQGSYSAMKAALKGFTEALRMEIEIAGYPVTVTLVKPSAMDTPYIEHARTKLGAPSAPPPPPSMLYDPELTAKAICFAAEHKRRAITVGGAGLMMTALAPLQPRLSDLVLEQLLDADGQTGDQPPEPGAYDNLFEPREDGRVDSNQDHPVRHQSLYLEAQMHPLATAAIVAGAAGAAAWLFSKRERS
jgi:short-subunit dehydrogenase